MFDIRQFLSTQHPKNGRFFTIAIDGRGGSGKSTYAELLKPALPGAVVLNGDDYFEPIDDPVVWGDFNDDRFIQDVIEPLKVGSTFTYRPYDWHAEPPIREQVINVENIFCLERCYSFTFDIDWDMKIWIEVSRDICLERTLERESMPRERILAASKVWQDREDTYIQRYHPQEKADILVDGLTPFS